MASTPRGVVALDRVVTLLAGLALVAGGAFVFAWHQGYLAKDPFRLTATQVSFPWMTSTVGASWWPWAAGAIGVVLALLALVWLVRHLTGGRVGMLTLPGSGAQGGLQVDAGAAAAAAADEISAASDDVRSCRSKVVLDRGQMVAVLEPVLEQGADLSAVTPVARASAEKLVRMVGRQDLTYRVQLRVARREEPVTHHRVE